MQLETRLDRAVCTRNDIAAWRASFLGALSEITL
jgi:hypothetical protein